MYFSWLRAFYIAELKSLRGVSPFPTLGMSRSLSREQPPHISFPSEQLWRSPLATTKSLPTTLLSPWFIMTPALGHGADGTLIVGMDEQSVISDVKWGNDARKDFDRQGFEPCDIPPWDFPVRCKLETDPPLIRPQFAYPPKSPFRLNLPYRRDSRLA